MTAKGDQLIATMVKAEGQLDKDFERRLIPIFDLLDPFELDETYGPFEAAFLELLEETSGRFLKLQDGFLKAYIRTEFGYSAAATGVTAAFSSRDRERYASSLSVVTRAAIKSHTANGDNIVKAYNDAKTRAAGVGKRSAREASREHMGRVSMSTKGIKGYKRVATGNETCSFCDLLISRGAVYSYESVGFKAHSDCDCLGIPTADGPAPSPAQKHVATPSKSKMFDREKAKQAVRDWEARRDRGEIKPLPPEIVERNRERQAQRRGF